MYLKTIILVLIRLYNVSIGFDQGGYCIIHSTNVLSPLVWQRTLLHSVSYRIFFSVPRYNYKTEKELETHVALRSYICHQMAVANLKIALTSFSLWGLVAGEQGFTHNWYFLSSN